MAVNIVPSVLARTPGQFQTQWSLAKAFGQVVHLDLADETLVPGRTVGPAVVSTIDRQQPVEVHAMTRRPDRWLPLMLRLRLRRVILHAELGASLRPYIAMFRSHRLPVTLALNPESSITKIRPWRSVIQGVQVMGVHPGRLGATWQPQTIARIKQLRRAYPRLPLSCDGGMTPNTIPLVVAAGATQIVVGSYFHRHQDPEIAWAEVRQAARSRRG